MKKTTIISVMAVLCLNFSLAAQEIKPLKVGGKVPDSVLNYTYDVINHPQGKTSVNLNDYQGKLLLLDFWASWCGSCLAAFSKLDSLQTKYKDKLQILLVSAINTNDKTQRMINVLKGAEVATQATQLPSLINDTLLMRLFPHKYLPHYIWIDAKGEVIAITGAEFVTEANIVKLLPKIKYKQP